jgi:N utilization substance protein B
MASRRKGRVLAFQALFAWDGMGGGELDPSLPAFEWLSDAQAAALGEETAAFSRLLLHGTIENIAAVDAAIQARLEHWDFSRVSRVDKAILRLSVYCLLFQPDIPAPIVIDEAIGMARDFGGPDSFRFINGILDAVRKTAL